MPAARERTWAGWLRHHAESRPDMVAVRDEEGALTFAELLDGACRLIQGLADRGVGRGSVVSAQVHNLREFAYLVAASSLGGFILSPINPKLTVDDVEEILRRSGSRVLVSSMEPIAIPDGRIHVAIGRAPVDGEIDLAGLMSDHAGLPAEPDPDDAVVMLMTSGTEGRPKLVVHSHASYWRSTVPVIERAKLDVDDVVLVAVPVTSSTGMHGLLYTGLAAGCRTVLLDGWDVVHCADIIENEGVTFSIAPATILFDLLGQAKKTGADLTSLRLFVCGGAPIPRTLVMECTEVLTCDIVPMYGASEVLAATMGIPGESAERLTTTDGRALEGVELQARLADGTVAGVGQEGELWVRGVTLFSEYFNDPEQTHQVLVDGWCRTGDLATVDAEGYVDIRDRLKDIVVRGGLNVSSREVELVLVQHESVAAVSIVGTPDERLGERICAVVVPVPGAKVELGELAEFARQAGLSKQKWPERLVCMQELPTNPTGKILKRELRRQLADEGKRATS